MVVPSRPNGAPSSLRGWVLLFCCLVSLFSSACSAEPSEPDDSLSTSFGGQTPSPRPKPQTSCTRALLPPEEAPLALTFLFDGSGSMNVPLSYSKRQAAMDALLVFSDSTPLRQLSIALQQFPAIYADRCASLSYEEPLVPLARAPRVSTSLKRALLTWGGGGPTSPLAPAIRGTLNFLDRVRAESPEQQVALILLTDGLANDCNTTVEDVIEIARQGYEELAIPTFVVGLARDELLTELHAIARAGGTGQALFPDVSDRHQNELFQTLSEIRRQTTSCRFALPSENWRRLHPDQLTLRFRARPGGELEIWPLLDRPERCAGENTGFYFEPESLTFSLCPASCERARQTELGAELLLDVSCVEVMR